ncbi:MAG: hypothetical protein AAB254_00005, partial [candidate division NC10 bacterium]
MGEPTFPSIEEHMGGRRPDVRRDGSCQDIAGPAVSHVRGDDEDRTDFPAGGASPKARQVDLPAMRERSVHSSASKCL